MRVAIALLSMTLTLSSYTSASAADIPSELKANWHPCAGDFGGHTTAANAEWNIGSIRFEVQERPGDSRYFLNVTGEGARSLRDVAWHIVEGTGGALQVPDADPAKVCDSEPPVDQFVEGRDTYMVAIADLSSKSDDGTYCGPSPHLLTFVPFEAGQERKKSFFLTVTHLGDKCISSASHKAASHAKAKSKSALGTSLRFMHNGVVHGDS